MAVTYAMIGPLMSVLRPVAAFVTALVAGVAANMLPERLLPPMAAAPVLASGCGCGGSCDISQGKGRAPVNCSSPSSAVPGLVVRMRLGLGDAFGEMLADVGGWLLVGILVAGAILMFLPPGLLNGPLGGEFASMLAMLLLGVPVYVCASSSTPIAASLLLKGLSPGAALVFLLAGPATNATTITLMLRTFGGAITGVYVGTIVVCSLGFGYLTNRLYSALGFDIHAIVGALNEVLPAWLETASALLLLALIFRALLSHRHSHAH